MARELAAKAVPAEKAEPQAKEDEMAQVNKKSGPDVGAWLGRALRAIILLILVVLLGAAIGLAVFLFVPLGVRAFLQPVEENTARIAELEAELEEQAELIEAQQELLAEQQDSLDEMAAALGDQDGRLADQDGALEEFETALGAFETGLEEQGALVAGFEERVTALEDDLPGTGDVATLNRNIALLTAWQEILKARLRLVQNNPGSALDELALAQSTLQAVYAASDEAQQAELDPILMRLDLVIENLTENPFAATEDLEIAWHDLDQLITGSLVGLPEVEVLEDETLEGEATEGAPSESLAPETETPESESPETTTPEESPPEDEAPNEGT